MLRNRLKKNFKNLTHWLKQNQVESFRLYDRDIPEIPYIIDIYKDYAVVYEKGKKIEDEQELQTKRIAHHQNIKDALQDVLNLKIENIIFKQREKQEGKQQYSKSAHTNESFHINENNVSLEVNLRDYLDTGLFLDHRPLRKVIKETAQGKKVLNLFCYTGSVSVMAALGNAAQVTSVDLSNTYMQWCLRNFEVNQLPVEQHTFLVQDCMEFLKLNKNSFDIIFLDPPSFSNSKKMEQYFDIQRDHLVLVQSCMKSLAKDGILYFSNNFRKFKLDTKISEQYSVRDISLKTIPIDFRDKKIHVCFEIKH